MTIHLTGVAHGGEAVGREDDIVAFVALGLPGEDVEADILERKPRYLRGRVREVVHAVPERVTPLCSIFGTCGGCQWQHAGYGAQLGYKTQVLRDALARIGHFAEPPVLDPVASPQEWHYRNTVQFVPGALDTRGAPVAARSRTATGGRLLCFQRGHSHEVVPVEHCYIADEQINQTIHQAAWAELDDGAWRSLSAIQVRVVPGSGAEQIVLFGERRLGRDVLHRFVEATRRALPKLAGVLVAEARGGEARPIWGDDALSYEVAGHRLAVPADAFVQVNLGAAEKIVETTLDWLAPTPDDSVLDAYAGVGTFTLPLASRAGSVMAIEAHPSSAGALAASASQAGLFNVAVQQTTVEEGLRRLQGNVDAIALDPPRRGCSDQALRELLRVHPRKIAYVSCEPTTLARDLRHLVDGGYTLVQSQVHDLFPQTFHLESISLLVAA